MMASLCFNPSRYERVTHFLSQSYTSLLANSCVSNDDDEGLGDGEVEAGYC